MNTPGLNRQILHIALPLLLGGGIYLFFRPDTLLMFQWAEFLQVRSFIDSVRAIIHENGFTLPPLIIYSLPDALWAYSLVHFVRILWNKPNEWYFLAISGGILPELLQIPGIVPGTFDLLDLIIQCLFMALASLQFVNFKTKYNYEKSNS